MRHTRKKFLAGLVAVAATVGLAACSGDDDKTKDTTASTESVAPTTDAPATTAVPETTAAETTAPPTTMAGVEVSPATAAFATEHSAELGAFAASVSTFSGEATSYLSDVSKAPSAAQVQADAKALIAVLPERGTDEQLDLIRDVAEGVDNGITKAIAGDHGGAIADLTVAQTKGGALTELLTALMG